MAKNKASPETPYTVFGADGRVLRTGQCPRRLVTAMANAGEAAVEGAFDWRTTTLVAGKIVMAAVVAPSVEVAQIKAEAGRRILRRWPLCKQMNLMAEGGKAFEAMRAEIDAVRAASNTIEAMHPIPADFSDPKWWPDVA